MIDLGTSLSRKNDLRLELCSENKRDSETLIPFILKNVHRDSIIISDQWRAYGRLQKYGIKVCKF